ncbi:MAG: hypothetical protein G01um101417_333 [Parcubacteria group bacterium Gr01-1014_17]|nr:MAG: hypothetical protein G01um101417_333 [Parcubacteria group bacterium Gr01-1014_17]
MNKNSVFIICEAGVTNYGDFNIAKKQIDAAVAAQADAVKFQLWRTEDLVSKKVAKKYQKELGYDWFARLKYKELAPREIKALQAYAKEKHILFFATAHDVASLEYLDKELHVPFFKVGSGEAGNIDFLKNVGKRRKPVFISFGFHTDAEARKAMRVLKKSGAPRVIPLHCVTVYPTPFNQVNLLRIGWFRRAFGIAGFSDHSVGRAACLAAVARGASVIEKHLTFDKKDPRSLDNPGALLPDEFVALVREVRDIESALRVPSSVALQKARAKARAWAEQAIVAARDIAAGEKVTRAMLAFKRPAKGGVSSNEIGTVLGKNARVAIPADEQVLLKDLS